jgi:hypothetical protein
VASRRSLFDETEALAAKLGCENTDFFVQIGDDPLLMTLDPTGEHGERDLEDHSTSSGWRS